MNQLPTNAEISCADKGTRYPDEVSVSIPGVRSGPEDSALQVVADSDDASAWDHFLETLDGGHHVQSTLWAQVKAELGWNATRLELRQAGKIVGGFQMLVRPLPVYGAFGYVPKGPLLADEFKSHLPRMIRELHRVAREQRLQYLMVQPPDNGHQIAEQLRAAGFRVSPLEAFPIATTAVDLRPAVDTILANMKSKTRYNIRYAARNGITVRLGDDVDLATFHRLLMATAERQGFDDYSLDYFETMHRLFGAQGYSQLFVADYDGKPVSALLAIPFGRTVLFKKGGWSGERGQCYPNEAMHWAAIQWAKSHGYQWYDFEGINSDAARAIVAGQPLPKALVDSVTRFKLGFGGNVQLVPDAYGYVYNPVFRWAHNSVYPHLANVPVINRFLNGLKTR